MNYLGFESKELGKTTEGLNQLLANYQVYYQNLRNYHWNISGQHFFDLHIQFEELYNIAKGNIDAIAERILTLRQEPMSTLAQYLEMSIIKEQSTVDPQEMVRIVLSNHRDLISCMRGVISHADQASDEGTIDLIAGFLAEVEKKSWMLDAWNQRN